MKNVEIDLLIQPFKKGGKDLLSRLGEAAVLDEVGRLLKKTDHVALYVASKNPDYEFKAPQMFQEEEGGGGVDLVEGGAAECIKPLIEG